MKTIGGALAQHLAGEVRTLATCWKITRRDGVVQGSTDHVRDLEIDGVTYMAASGCTRTAMRSTNDLGLLDFDARAYGRIPDGQQLRALCERHLIAIPIAAAAPGDVLLLRFTLHPQHLAIVGDRGFPFSLIHAYADAGACVEHGADPKWLPRIVAAYSFKQPH